MFLHALQLKLLQFAQYHDLKTSLSLPSVMRPRIGRWSYAGFIQART